MEIGRVAELTRTAPHMAQPANDDRLQALRLAFSPFPREAKARIFRPGRSVTTSGKARTKAWRLIIERRRAPYIEPLMGWTGGDDTLAQIELSFPTLEAAKAYAERQGLAYIVERNGRSSDADERSLARRKRAFSDATLDRLGLAALQESYGRALPQAANSNAASDDPAKIRGAAMKVVNDPELSLNDKRSILMNWAWREYLLAQAAGENTPENGRPSPLREIEHALLALENGVAPAAASPAPAARTAA